MQETYQLTANDVIMQKTPCGFDVSVWEFFWPLFGNFSLFLAKPDGHADPAYLWHHICAANITVIHFVPSMLRRFISAKCEAATKLRHIFCSGEALPTDLAQRTRDLIPSAEIHNLYGPTEAAIDVTFWQCHEAEPVCIGRPISNVQVFILNHGQLCPPGVTGELCLAGVNLAMGYLNDQELTEQVFVNNVPNLLRTMGVQRYYRTGDLARLNCQGCLEYLGRASRSQVKINGQRVELGEIESCLRSCAFVGAASVQWQDGKLAAYVEPLPHLKHLVSAQPEREKARRVIETLHERPLPEGFDPKKCLQLGRVALGPRPGAVDEAQHWSRRSSRRFGQGPTELQKMLAVIGQEGFAEFRGPFLQLRLEQAAAILAPLREVRRPDSIRGKYLYPSAGSTYSVQVFLLSDHDEHFYDAQRHALLLGPYSKSFSQVSHFKLCWRPELAKKLYEDKAARFAEIEAGCMLALIQKEAAKLNLEMSVSHTEHEEHLAIIGFRQAPARAGQSLKPQLDIYVYVQNCVGSTATGLYKWDQGLRNLRAVNWALTHPLWTEQHADAARVIYDAAFLLLCFGPSGETLCAGALLQELCLVGAECLGLCPLGRVVLPNFPEQREPLIALAGGALAKSQMEKPKTWLELLREHVLRCLPLHMLPKEFFLGDLPLTASGKLDTKALCSEVADAPLTEEEARLASLWRTSLGLGDGDTVDLCRSFMELGGDSRAFKVLRAKVKEAFGVNLVAAQALGFDLREMMQAIRSEDQSIPLSDERFKHKASVGQLGIFQAAKFEPRAYHIYLELTLSGSLDLLRLQRAIDQLAKCHPVLSLAYSEHYDAGEMNLVMVPCPLEPLQLEGDMGALITTPFEAGRPLWRAQLLRLDTEHHVLGVVLHHMIADGESLDILVDHLTAAYNGIALPAPGSFADFVARQWRELEEPEAQKKLKFWEAKLKGIQQTELPLDAERGSERLGGRVSRQLLETDIAAKRRASLIRSAFCLLLHQTCSQKEIVTAMAASHRYEGEGGHEDLIGLYVNTIPLRSQWTSDMDTSCFIQAVENFRLESFQWQLPFQYLLQNLPESCICRDSLGQQPIFQTLLILLDDPRPDVKLHGLEPIPRLAARGVDTRHADVDLVPQYDMVLRVDILSDDQWRLTFDFDASIFKATTVERLADDYCRLLFSLAEVELPLVLANPRPKSSLSKLLTSALEDPRSIALAAVAASALAPAVSFGALHTWARCLAQRLAGEGVVSAVLRLPRCAGLVAAILGCLLGGITFIPTDAMPLARVATVVQNCAGLTWLLTSVDTRGEAAELDLPWCCVEDYQDGGLGVLKLPVDDDEKVAYVMHTSGSSGKPKGVELSRGNLCSFLETMTGMLEGLTLEAPLVWLSCTSPSFDIFLLEILGPLLLGGTIVLAPDEVLRDGLLLQQALLQSGASVLQLTPGRWSLLSMDFEETFLALCGGEQMSPLLAKSFLASKAKVLNMYGPTEATIWATCKLLEGTFAAGLERVIGRPLANTVAMVENGELLLAGPGVAKGYRNLPDLTAEKFRSFGGVRVYATGDVVERIGEEWVWLGRRDSQVKVNGHRVELGEVESCLLQHPCVGACAVVCQSEGAHSVLVAFVELCEAVSDQELRAFCEKTLECYKIPDFRRCALPLNPNGKIDRQALVQQARPRTAEREASHCRAAPARPMATGLVPAADVEMSVPLATQALWRVVSALLGSSQIGLDDDFFAFGMTSARAIEAQRRLKADGFSLRVNDFYAFRTCNELGPRLLPCATSPVPTLTPAITTVPIASSDCAVQGLAIRAAWSDGQVQFWDRLLQGADCVRDFSDSELVQLQNLDGCAEGTVVRSKGVISDFACFDADLFRLSLQEAQQLSPLHRCFLESAVHALEDAGIQMHSAGKIAVFAGMGDHDYLAGSFSSAEDLRIDLANSKDFLASRVSYALDFSGPSVNVQTACSTGLVAVALARTSLGDCDAALAGSVSLSPMSGARWKGDNLPFSPTGRCRAFSADADGIVVGQGVGCVLVQPVEGSPEVSPHCQLLCAAVNCDGAAKSAYQHPSQKAQANLVAETMQKANVYPGQVDMIECHGTGTRIGDPCEVAALSEAFQRRGSLTQGNFKGISGFGACTNGATAIGSCKSNFGHTGAAAGIVGFIKSCLCVSKSIVPATLHCHPPNADIDFETSPFFLAQEFVPGARLSGVSSFGLGGTNAHALVHARVQPQVARPTQSNFRREVFWHPEAQGAIFANHGYAQEECSHPFLQHAPWCNRRRIYDCKVSQPAHEWLWQHAPHGKAVFPGAGWVELFITAALREGFGDVCLRQVWFERPLPLAEECRFQIRVERAEAGFDLRATGPDGVPTFARAFLPASFDRAAREFPSSPHGLREVDVTSIYHNAGQGYGPAFQTVKQMEADGDFGVATVAGSLPAGFSISPALLDGAMQVMLGKHRGAGEVWPQSIQAIYFYNHYDQGPTSSCTVQAQWSAGRALKGCFSLCSGEAVLLQAEDLVFAVRKEVDTDGLVVQPAWEEVPAPDAEVLSTPLLALVQQGGLGEALMSAAGRAIDSLPAAQSLSALYGPWDSESEGSKACNLISEMSRHNPEDYPLTVWYLWSLDCGGAGELSEELERCCQCLLLLVRGLLQGQAKVARLLVVTSGATNLKSQVHLSQSAFVGLCRAIRLECPQLHLTHVDLELHPS
ncbi:unnamed protein product, partial [Effrenium voratum]